MRPSRPEAERRRDASPPLPAPGRGSYKLRSDSETHTVSLRGAAREGPRLSATHCPGLALRHATCRRPAVGSSCSGKTRPSSPPLPPAPRSPPGRLRSGFPRPYTCLGLPAQRSRLLCRTALCRQGPGGTRAALGALGRDALRLLLPAGLAPACAPAPALLPTAPVSPRSSLPALQSSRCLLLASTQPLRSARHPLPPRPAQFTSSSVTSQLESHPDRVSTTPVSGSVPACRADSWCGSALIRMVLC